MIFPLIAASLMACSNDDESGDSHETTQERPIGITVTERPFVSPDGSNRSTRAAITTTESLTSFKMSYVYGTPPSTGDRTATKMAGVWNVTGSWPDTGDNVYWYAYSSGTFHLTNDVNKYPYVNFTMEEQPSNLKDLLVATASGSWSSTGGIINYTFDHACSALRFYVKKANNLQDYVLRVSRVKLWNVVKTGDYYFNTPSWTLGEDKSGYTLYSGDAKTLDHTDYVALDDSEDPYLFFIPQTLTPWAPPATLENCYLEVDCVLTKGETPKFSGTAYIPFGTTLAQGTLYDVKVNIGKNSLYNNSGEKIIKD